VGEKAIPNSLRFYYDGTSRCLYSTTRLAKAPSRPGGLLFSCLPIITIYVFNYVCNKSN